MSLPELGEVSDTQQLSVPTKRALIFLGVLIAVFGIAIASAVVYAKTYDNRVMPGLYVGDIYIGGMGESELHDYLLTISDKLNKDGIRLTVRTDGAEKQVNVLPQAPGGDSFPQFVELNAKETTQYLMQYGRTGSSLSGAWRTLDYSFTKRQVPLTLVTVNTQAVVKGLKDALTPFETQTKNADIVIGTLEPFSYTITPSAKGMEFHYDKIANEAVSSWSELRVPVLTVAPEIKAPAIDEQKITAIADRAEMIVKAGPIQLAYVDQNKINKNWTVTKEQIGSWIQPQETADKTLAFGAEQKLVEEYLQQSVVPTIYKEARDAKFRMEHGRVMEFQGSQPGVTLNIDEAYHAINAILLSRNNSGAASTGTVALAVTTVEPNIPTGKVNDLGIEEILGVGYSSYKGSPTNRIKNIRFAVRNKLNGILVKPGETFSMLDALKPFTIEGGYLPELVIKGDRIKPEVGGGLCQVGSTMFRAAMNSGLSIEERRNHSLVVSYYNDPRNNQPGADATIYDPAPDFKFKNDTDGYVLVNAEMNEKTQELFFTLWGKSDGRKGSYAPPVVSKWIPVGPTKEVITDELAPGARKCQEPHPGAHASLTYTIELPNGEKKHRIFESYYRPLPRICLVGGDPAAVPAENASEPIVPVAEPVLVE